MLGKNGSGKSTLLKTMAGLDFPNAGKCLVHGTDASRRLVSVLEDLYFLPEEISVPALTPRQFVKNTAGFYPAFSASDYYAHLRTLEVEDELMMSRMSYGQQKKAMIAFALATNTQLLLLDEPTNGLDIPSKVQFRKLIASSLDERRCFVLSTHQVRDLDSLIDTVLILDNERIVVQHTIEELTNQLIFGLFQDTSELHVLYEEDTPRGKYIVAANTQNKFSKLDLELFFNAVTDGRKEVIDAISKGGYHE